MYAAYKRSAKSSKATITKHKYARDEMPMRGGSGAGHGKLTSFIALDSEILSKYQSLISEKDVVVTNANLRETIDGVAFNIQCTFVGYKSKEVSELVSAINFYIHWFASKTLPLTRIREVPNIEIYMYNIDHNKTVDVSVTDIGRYVLSQKDVNTGFTVFLGNTNAIYIYRNEERVKVLLHELVHATMCEHIYMPNMAEINTTLERVWGIASPKVGESVCDAIAIMLHTYFASLRGDSKVDKDVLRINRDAVLAHVWKQAARVYVLAGFKEWNGLNVRGTPISRLGDDRNNRGIEFAYQQDTSVFEYYIIKAFLLQSYPAGEVRILTAPDIIDICRDPDNVAKFNEEIAKRLGELKKASTAREKVSLRMTPNLGLTGGRAIISLQAAAKSSYKKAYGGYHNCVVKRM